MAAASAPIPDRTCVEQFLLVPPGQQSNFSALHETWETSNSVRREDGHTLAFFNPYFQVELPSRFHDPAIAPTVGPADRRLLRGHRRRAAGYGGPATNPPMTARRPA